MAITALIQTQATGYAGRSAGNYMRFRVDTEAELPTTDVINGDSGFTNDTGRIYARITGSWVDTTTTAAHAASHGNGGTDEVALDVSQVTGLGSAATTASTDYATAAQGATANSALQPAGNGSALTGLTKAQVGLANADNTADSAKPVSTAQQTALDAKQATLVSGTNIKTVNGGTMLGSGNLAVSASDPSYTPGSFTVATGTGRMIIKRMALASTERSTIAGTARLRLT